MARTDLRHLDNAPGDWFVDTRCIDCGTCRELAPELFREVHGLTVISRQPDRTESEQAWLAAQACPTNSIGTRSRQTRPGRLYPREIEAGSGVFACGYNSPDSFGASAWLVARDAGNLMIDAPRYTLALAQPIAERGGLAHILLTHRDDVADAARWAAEFGARVWIHADDARAAPFATDLFQGTDPVTVAPGMVAHPAPGHTRGSVLFLLDQQYLFTGDSLAWSHEHQRLIAFRGACWYSWEAQTESLERLLGTPFTWVLPGHGASTHGTPAALQESLARLVEGMHQGRG